MRSWIVLLCLILTNSLLSQNEKSVVFVDSISLNAERFVGADDFENYYYLKGNSLFKKTASETYSYMNTQLGAVHSVDISNPLKILVFYRDFNTVLLLDNRLNELSDRINLNEAGYGKNTNFASVSSNNNLWLYSLDDNILTLWDYENKESLFESQPLQFYSKDFEAILQYSTYRYCWLVSNEGLIRFNEFGSFIEAKPLKGIKALGSFNEQLVFLQNDQVYIQKNDTIKALSSVKSGHLSTNFFVNKNWLYFYDSAQLFRYRILKN